MRLRADRRALIPRPETEELADLLSRRKPSPASILDLGAGSGALTLALGRAFPEAELIAVERNPEALRLARENARSVGMENRIGFLEGDWFEPLPSEARFDWIVSNPPYLTEEEWKVAQPEVRDFEPYEALVAAEAGCADLERILAAAPGYLNPGGLVALETGVGQHARLSETARAAGFAKIESACDLTGRERFLLATRG